MPIGQQSQYDDMAPVGALEIGPADATADIAASFGRNVVSTALGNAVTPVVGLATAPILVHALGVAGRGEFAATTSPTLLLTLAGTLGLPQAVTYFVASGRLSARVTTRRACTQSILVGVLLAALVAALAPAIAGGNHHVASIMFLGVLTLPGALVVGVVRGTASGRHRWGLVNLDRGGGNILRLLLVIGFAVTGHLGLLQATMIYLLSPVVIGVVYLPLLRSIWREPVAPPREAVSESALLAYGMRIWIGGIAGVVLSRLDQVLMTPLSGARQLGLYAAAVAIGELPYVFSGATRDVILAADAAASNDFRAAQASRLTFLATVVFSGLLAAVSPLVILVAYGSAFADSTSMLLLLLAASVLYTPGMTSAGVLVARGRATLPSASVAAACAVNVILLPILVPPWGGNGAALASVAAYAVYSAINLVLLRRHSSLKLRAMLVPSKDDFSWVTQRISGRLHKP